MSRGQRRHRRWRVRKLWRQQRSMAVAASAVMSIGMVWLPACCAQGAPAVQVGPTQVVPFGTDLQGLATELAAGASASTGDDPVDPNPPTVENTEGLATGLTTPWLISGAVGPIVVDPQNPNTLYVGAVNGGVWKSVNQGRSWTALTPHQSSPSIGALAVDPSAPQTVVAGFGNFSSAAEFGGELNGLILSNDGGKHWSPIGGNALQGQQIDGVTVAGHTILAGSFGGPYGTSDAGVYRSANGGASFQRVLPGEVTSLVADPHNPALVYAAVVDGGNSRVYRSTDGGADWQPVFTDTSAGGVPLNADTRRLVLATGPNGSVAVSVLNRVPESSDPAHHQDAGIVPVAIYLSKSKGGQWTRLTMPTTTIQHDGQTVSVGLEPLGQGEIHFSMGIDPNNPSFVYVGGTTQLYVDPKPNSIGAHDYTAPVFRIALKPDGTSTATPLTNDFAANNGAPHADTRAMAFSGGKLLLTSDGGVYSLTQPQHAGGSWAGLNNGLSLLEAYKAVRDPLTGQVLVAAQDNGVLLQRTPGQGQFEPVASGDGFNVAVNATSLAVEGRSVDYVGTNELDVVRSIVSSDGVRQNAKVDFLDGGVSINHGPNGIPLASQMALNHIDPTRIAIGTDNAYVGTDNLTAPTPDGVDKIAMTNLNLGTQDYQMATTIDFGTRDNPDALLMGFTPYGSAPALFVSTAKTLAPGTLQPAAGWKASYAFPRSAVFAPFSQQDFYVANETKSIYGTSDGGQAFTDLRGNLPKSFVKISSLAYVSADGVKALLAGGMSSAANAPSDVYVAQAADLKDWSPFALGTPNVLAYNLNYDAAGNELLISTLGRGVWTVHDVTTWFPSATVLRFGAANNDSTPVAAQLTDGRKPSTGAPFSRGLVKTGTGTLYLPGALSTYTGSTTVKQGVLAVSGQSALGESSALNLDGGELYSAGDSRIHVPVRVGYDGGLMTQGTPGTLTLAGSLAGPGALDLYAFPGASIIDNDPPGIQPLSMTRVLGGTFTVGDTAHPGAVLHSPVTVLGGTLDGNGSIDGDVTNVGGTVAPGTPLGTLNIAGDYLQRSAGVLLVSLTPDKSAGPGKAYSQLRVAGSASVAGTLAVSAEPGTYTLGTRYDVVHATQGVDGAFSKAVFDGALSGYIDADPQYASQSVAVTLDPAPLAFTSGRGFIAHRFTENQALFTAFDAIVGNGHVIRPRRGAWGDALGSFGHADAFAIHYYGGVVGHGVQVAPDWVVGGALAGFGTSTSDAYDDVSGQSGGLYGYAVYTHGRLRLSGALGAGGSSINTTRRLRPTDLTAHGSTSGWFAGTALSAQYHMPLPAHTYVAPFAIARYLHSDNNGMTEHGAGTFDIRYGAVRGNATTFSAGLRAGWAVTFDKTVVAPWVMLGGTGAVGPRQSATPERIATFSSTQSAIAVPSGTVDAGAGLDVGHRRRWSITLAWNGNYAHRSVVDNVALRARYDW